MIYRHTEKRGVWSLTATVRETADGRFEGELSKSNARTGESSVILRSEAGSDKMAHSRLFDSIMAYSDLPMDSKDTPPEEYLRDIADRDFSDPERAYALMEGVDADTRPGFNKKDVTGLYDALLDPYGDGAIAGGMAVTGPEDGPKYITGLTRLNDDLYIFAGFADEHGNVYGTPLSRYVSTGEEGFRALRTESEKVLGIPHDDNVPDADAVNGIGSVFDENIIAPMGRKELSELYSALSVSGRLGDGDYVMPFVKETGAGMTYIGAVLSDRNGRPYVFSGIVNGDGRTYGNALSHSVDSVEEGMKELREDVEKRLGIVHDGKLTDREALDAVTPDALMRIDGVVSRFKDIHEYAVEHIGDAMPLEGVTLMDSGVSIPIRSRVITESDGSIVIDTKSAPTSDAERGSLFMFIGEDGSPVISTAEFISRERFFRDKTKDDRSLLEVRAISVSRAIDKVLSADAFRENPPELSSDGEVMTDSVAGIPYDAAAACRVREELQGKGTADARKTFYLKTLFGPDGLITGPEEMAPIVAIGSLAAAASYDGKLSDEVKSFLSEYEAEIRKEYGENIRSGESDAKSHLNREIQLAAMKYADRRGDAEVQAIIRDVAMNDEYAVDARRTLSRDILGDPEAAHSMSDLLAGKEDLRREIEAETGRILPAKALEPETELILDYADKLIDRKHELVAEGIELCEKELENELRGIVLQTMKEHPELESTFRGILDDPEGIENLRESLAGGNHYSLADIAFAEAELPELIADLVANDALLKDAFTAMSSRDDSEWNEYLRDYPGAINETSLSDMDSARYAFLESQVREYVDGIRHAYGRRDGDDSFSYALLDRDLMRGVIRELRRFSATDSPATFFDILAGAAAVKARHEHAPVPVDVRKTVEDLVVEYVRDLHEKKAKEKASEITPDNGKTYITVIGSRSIADNTEAAAMFRSYVEALNALDGKGVDIVMRSGGAAGADTIADEAFRGEKEIILPFQPKGRALRDEEIVYSHDAEAENTVRRLHPIGNRIVTEDKYKTTKPYLERDVIEVIGPVGKDGTREPASSIVIGWTEPNRAGVTSFTDFSDRYDEVDALWKGGSRMAALTASDLNDKRNVSDMIPVINVASEKGRRELSGLILDLERGIPMKSAVALLNAGEYRYDDELYRTEGAETRIKTVLEYAREHISEAESDDRIALIDTGVTIPVRNKAIVRRDGSVVIDTGKDAGMTPDGVIFMYRGAEGNADISTAEFVSAERARDNMETLGVSKSVKNEDIAMAESVLIESGAVSNGGPDDVRYERFRDSIGDLQPSRALVTEPFTGITYDMTAAYNLRKAVENAESTEKALMVLRKSLFGPNGLIPGSRGMNPAIALGSAAVAAAYDRDLSYRFRESLSAHIRDMEKIYGTVRREKNTERVEAVKEDMSMAENPRNDENAEKKAEKAETKPFGKPVTVRLSIIRDEDGNGMAIGAAPRADGRGAEIINVHLEDSNPMFPILTRGTVIEVSGRMKRSTATGEFYLEASSDGIARNDVGEIISDAIPEAGLSVFDALLDARNRENGTVEREMQPVMQKADDILLHAPVIERNGNPRIRIVISGDSHIKNPDRLRLASQLADRIVGLAGKGIDIEIGTPASDGFDRAFISAIQPSLGYGKEGRGNIFMTTYTAWKNSTWLDRDEEGEVTGKVPIPYQTPVPRTIPEDVADVYYREAGKSIYPKDADTMSKREEYLMRKRASSVMAYLGNRFSDPASIVILGTDADQKRYGYGDVGDMARLARLGGAMVYDTRTSSDREKLLSALTTLEGMSKDEIADYLRAYAADRAAEGKERLAERGPEGQKAIDTVLSLGDGHASPSIINAFRGRYAFLSNEAHTPFEYNGTMYESVQEAYDTLKENIPDKGSREAEESLMKDILSAKFSVPYYRERLASTGNAELFNSVSGGDTRWGVVDGKGENILGKMLTDIRSSIPQKEAMQQDAASMERPEEFSMDAFLKEQREALSMMDAAAPVVPSETKEVDIRRRYAFMPFRGDNGKISPYQYLEPAFTEMVAVETMDVKKRVSAIEGLSGYRRTADSGAYDIGKFIRGYASAYLGMDSTLADKAEHSVDGLGGLGDVIAPRFAEELEAFAASLTGKIPDEMRDEMISPDKRLKEISEEVGRTVITSASRGLPDGVFSRGEAAAFGAYLSRIYEKGGLDSLSAIKNLSAEMIQLSLDPEGASKDEVRLIEKLETSADARSAIEKGVKFVYREAVRKTAEMSFPIFGGDSRNAIMDMTKRLTETIRANEGDSSVNGERAAVEYPVLQAVSVFSHIPSGVRADIVQMKDSIGMTFSQIAINRFRSSSENAAKIIGDNVSMGMFHDDGSRASDGSKDDAENAYKAAFRGLLSTASPFGPSIMGSDYGYGYVEDANREARRSLSAAVGALAAAAPSVRGLSYEKAATRELGEISHDPAAMAVFKSLLKKAGFRSEVFSTRKAKDGKAVLDHTSVVISGGPAMPMDLPDSQVSRTSFYIEDESVESLGAFYRSNIEDDMGTITSFNAANEVGRPEVGHTEEAEEQQAIEEYLEMSHDDSKKGSRAVEFTRIRDAIDTNSRRLDEDAPMPDFEGQLSAHAKDEAEAGLGYLRPESTATTYIIGHSNLAEIRDNLSAFRDALRDGKEIPKEVYNFVRSFIPISSSFDGGDHKFDITDKKIAETWTALEKGGFMESFNIRDSLFDVSMEIQAAVLRTDPAETRFGSSPEVRKPVSFALPPIYRSVNEYMQAYAVSLTETGDRKKFGRTALFPKYVTVKDGRVVPDWSKGVNPAYTKREAELYGKALSRFLQGSDIMTEQQRANMTKDVAAIISVSVSPDLDKVHPAEKNREERESAALATRFFEHAEDYIVKGMSFVPIERWPVVSVKNTGLDMTAAVKVAEKYLNAEGKSLSDFKEKKAEKGKSITD